LGRLGYGDHLAVDVLCQDFLVSVRRKRPRAGSGARAWFAAVQRPVVLSSCSG
jgi:hypothetical protein